MNDMRQLFETARGDLPPAPFSVDEITENGRRSRRRRTLTRSLTAVAAAAAVAAVAVVGIPYLQGAGTPAVPGKAIAPAAPKPKAPSVPPFTYTIAGYTVGEFRVESPVEVTPGYESAPVVRDHAVDIGVPEGIKQQAGLLTVYRAGAFDPSEFKSGTAATVAGHSALARTFPKTVQVPQKSDVRKTVETTIQIPAIAWQYAGDSWATITAVSDNKHYGMTAAQVKAVAEKFAPAAKGAVATAPYTIGKPPAGWKLAVAGTNDPDVSNDGEVSRGYLARDGVSFTGLTGRIDFSEGKDAGLLLTVQKSDTEGPYPHPFKKCMNSESGLGAFCDRPIGKSGYYIEVADSSKTLTPAQVGTITASLTFTDPTKTSTWVPVAK
jgi:hypothetical protein